MSGFDPNRASRVDRKKRQMRESKRIDYRDIDEFFDEDEIPLENCDIETKNISGA